jgi:hypothetical protein
MASRAAHREATRNRLIALQHPLRTAIFRILTERTASIGEMAKELGLGRQEIANVRHHVHRLVALGCAEEVGRRHDGGHVIRLYKATERALVETDEWDRLLEKNPLLAEHLLGEFMQVQLDDYSTAVEAGTLGQDDEFHITHTPRILDAEGVSEGMALYEECRLQMDEVERRSAERRANDGSDAVPVSANLSLFKMPPSKSC